MVNPVLRSTRVPIAEAFDLPMMSRVAPAHCCAGSDPVDQGCASARARSSTRCAPVDPRSSASTPQPREPTRSPPARRTSGNVPSARGHAAAEPRPRRPAPAAGAPTGVDDCDRIGDEPAVGHDLPELLQQIRTNEDRILSHRQHPISRCCDHRENPRNLHRDRG